MRSQAAECPCDGRRDVQAAKMGHCRCISQQQEPGAAEQQQGAKAKKPLPGEHLVGAPPSFPGLPLFELWTGLEPAWGTPVLNP